MGDYLKIAMSSEVTGYQCKICGVKRKTVYGLVDHEKRHKEDLGVIKQRPTNKRSSKKKCNLCVKQLSSNQSLIYHKKNVHCLLTETEENKCNICDKSLKNESSLKNHKLVVHEAEPLVKTCEICWREVNHLKLHQKWCHSSVRFECDICATTYKRKVNSKQHVEICHSDIAPKVVTCPICQKEFKYFMYLKRHQKIHEVTDKTKCEFCDVSMASKSKLRKHIQDIHCDLRPYKCQVCDKRFKRNGHLNEHKLIHTGERPHRCKTCSKTFSTTKSLSLHSLMHTGEKPHRCPEPECGKSFRQRPHLKAHLLSHSELRSYMCSECNKCYKTRNYLTLHAAIHLDTKKFSCQFCDAGFHWKHEFVKHMV